MAARTSARNRAQVFRSDTPLAALRYACNGLTHLARTQRNFRIHVGAAITVVIVASKAGATRLEWVALLVAIGMVWIAEALNTAVELVVDLVSPEWHPLAKAAKDVGAAAVLIAATCAVAIGAVVFWPHLAR